MDNIKIAIVDDQKLFLKGLGALISGISEFELLFDAENGSDFLQKLNNQQIKPDVVLVDFEMPAMNGMELLEILKNKYPEIKTLLLSGHSNERLISRLIQKGACGYLIKNCEKEELVNAIKSTVENGFYINQLSLKAMQNFAGNNNVSAKNNSSIHLTQREKEVLKLICEEYSNVEIGEKLFISPRTVDGHRNNLLLKTGVKNTAGLVLFAVKNNLVEIF